MSETIRLTKNDYGINLTYTIRDSTGVPLDISTATTMKLHIGRRGEAANLLDGTMSFVTNGADGQVKYLIASQDIDIPGYYDAEIEIDYAAGRRTSTQFTIHILEEL